MRRRTPTRQANAATPKPARSHEPPTKAPMVTGQNERREQILEDSEGGSNARSPSRWVGSWSGHPAHPARVEQPTSGDIGTYERSGIRRSAAFFTAPLRSGRQA